MKAIIFWIATILIFGITNGLIAHKESTIRHGVTMLLELAPRDPRSLMQGDYMALRYALANEGEIRRGRRGRLVVQLDDQGVAKFIRVHAQEPMAAGEHLLRFSRGPRGVRIGTDSFFFQEGHAKFYANARYGELRVSPSGESVLVGLRNADLSRAAADGS